MSDERELLRETVAALVAKHASPAAVREAMESERGYDESLWRLLCEQVGAAALVVPEEFGGAGGTLGDAAVVLEELGKGLVPSPLLGTTLAELALLAADEPDADALGSLAEGAAIGAVVFDPRLRGQRRRRRRRHRDRRRQTRPMDGIQRRARRRRWTRPAGWPASHRRDTAPLGTDPGIADAAAILLAAEQIGAATRCLELTVDYTKERQQFGRPIGSFQALKHRMADLYVAVQAARAVVNDAVDAAVGDIGGAGPRRGHRGVQHGGRRRHSAARRYRDHLGTRHAAVLQTRARQFAAAGSAARTLAPAGIRSVLALDRMSLIASRCAPGSRRFM